MAAEVWNLAQGKATAAFPFPDVNLNVLVFSPDGKALAVSSVQKKLVYVLDLQKNAALTPFPVVVMPGVQFTNDSTRVVLRQFGGPGKSGIAAMWDWRTGKQVNEPIPAPVVPPNANISPDGRYELIRLPNGIEVIDRTLSPPPVAAQRRKS